MPYFWHLHASLDLLQNANTLFFRERKRFISSPPIRHYNTRNSRLRLNQFIGRRSIITANKYRYKKIFINAEHVKSEAKRIEPDVYVVKQHGYL